MSVVRGNNSKIQGVCGNWSTKRPSPSWNLYFRMWIKVLAMFLCLSISVLNGKFGAAVQAAKAHNALLLHPYRAAVFHFNGVSRAFLCTQPASDTDISHLKVRRISRKSVIHGESDFPCKIRRGQTHMLTSDPALDLIFKLANFFVAFFKTLLNRFRIRKIKNRGSSVVSVGEIPA